MPNEVCDPGIEENCLDDCSGYDEPPTPPICESFTNNSSVDILAGETVTTRCEGNDVVASYRLNIYQGDTLVNQTTQNNGLFQTLMSYGGTYTLECTVFDQEQTDSDTCTNTVEVNVEELSAPNLMIQKRQSDDGQNFTQNNLYFGTGDTVVYKIAFENNGGSTQPDIQIYDPLPAGVQYIQGYHPTLGIYTGTINGQTYFFTDIFDLNAGSSQEIIITGQIAPDTTASQFANQAYIVDASGDTNGGG